MESGVAHAPTAPGLGLEINEKEAAKHPFAPEVTMPYFHRDGSVADW
jgi:galactonate dehydratase